MTLNPGEPEFFEVLIGAVCVIVEGGRLLGVDCSKGWGVILPGGKVESGETFREAAIREMWEEAGVRVYKTTLLYEGFSSPRGESYTYAFLVTDYDRGYQTLGMDLGSGKVGWYEKTDFLKSNYRAYYDVLFEVMDGFWQHTMG